MPAAIFRQVSLATILAASAVFAGPLAAEAADGTWTGVVEINPASDMVDESGPECRDGRVRLVLKIDGGDVTGRLEPLGNPGAPGFDRGPIALTGQFDAAAGRISLRSGPDDYHYNRLTGDLEAGRWRNAACWGEYRIERSS